MTGVVSHRSSIRLSVLGLSLLMVLSACDVHTGGNGEQNTRDNATSFRESSNQIPIAPVTAAPPLFDGFASINYFVGAYFDYSWEYTSGYNSIGNTPLSGTMRLEFIDSIDVEFTNLGMLTLYKTRTSRLSGDTFPLGWPAYEFMAARDGRIYIAQTDDAGGLLLSILFDAADGHIYETGFLGFFAGNRPETVNLGRISNIFVDHDAVVASEPFTAPRCRTIEGKETCGNQGHDYDVREFYIPGIGFGGFRRAGYSEYFSNGAREVYTSTMEVGLSTTNIGDIAALP